MQLETYMWGGGGGEQGDCKKLDIINDALMY